MRERAGGRRAVSSLILVVTAVLGLIGGSLTSRLVDDATADSGSDPEAGASNDLPADLVYYADATIHDGETEVPVKLEPGHRIADLARTANGWALAETNASGGLRWLILVSEGKQVYRQELSYQLFDVSPDGEQIAHVSTDQTDPENGIEVDIRSTASGRRIGGSQTLYAGIDAVYYSGEDMVIGGVNWLGDLQVSRQGKSTAAGAALGGVRLYDAAANTPEVVVGSGNRDDPCHRVVRLDLLAKKTVWKLPCGKRAAYDSGLSVDGRHLLTYPRDDGRSLPDRVDVSDPRDPDAAVSVEATAVVQVGWLDADTFLLVDQASTDPARYELRSCGLDADCETLVENDSRITIGRVT